MDDPLGQARGLLYARMINHDDISPDSVCSCLFTRPAVLAIADETAGSLPIQALNRACGLLMRFNNSAEGSDTISRVAGDSGFEDAEVFIRLFREATGWHPEDWHKSFAYDRIPVSG